MYLLLTSYSTSGVHCHCMSSRSPNSSSGFSCCYRSYHADQYFVYTSFFSLSSSSSSMPSVSCILLSGYAPHYGFERVRLLIVLEVSSKCVTRHVQRDQLECSGDWRRAIARLHGEGLVVRPFRSQPFAFRGYVVEHKEDGIVRYPCMLPFGMDTEPRYAWFAFRRDYILSPAKPILFFVLSHRFDCL